MELKGFTAVTATSCCQCRVVMLKLLSIIGRQNYHKTWVNYNVVIGSRVNTNYRYSVMKQLNRVQQINVQCECHIIVLKTDRAKYNWYRKHLIGCLLMIAHFIQACSMDLYENVSLGLMVRNEVLLHRMTRVCQ